MKNSREKRTPKKTKVKGNSKGSDMMNGGFSNNGTNRRHIDDNDNYNNTNNIHNNNNHHNHHHDDSSIPSMDHNYNNSGGGADYLSDEFTIADGDDSEQNSLSLLLEDDVYMLGYDHPSDDTDAILEGRRRGGGTPIDPTSQSVAVTRLQRLKDCISLLHEYTSEKRSSKREAIMRRLFRMVCNYATGLSGQSIVNTNCDTIINACFYSIRIGQPSEQYAACRVLQATSTILGSDQEDWYEQIQKQLTRSIHSSTISSAVRGAALRALCMSVFINSDDTHDTESIMDICEGIANPMYRNEIIPSSLRATAFDCWTVLATTIDDYYISGQDDEIIGRGLVLLPLLKQCLDTNDSISATLRSAAGECITVIHEARLNLGIDSTTMMNPNNNNNNNNNNNSIATTNNRTVRKYQRGSWDGSQFETIMEEIKIRMDELSNQTGHYMSKHVKKEQRKTFREYIATVCDNESPDETLYFSKNNSSSSLTLSTWKEIVQLEFVRHCFQSGFQIQLLTNPTLQEMFGFRPPGGCGGRGGGSSGSGGGGGPYNNNSSTDTSLSQIEKRLLLSKTSEVSKMADMKLTKERRKRQNVKNHFLSADDEN